MDSPVMETWRASKNGKGSRKKWEYIGFRVRMSMYWTGRWPSHHYALCLMERKPWSVCATVPMLLRPDDLHL